MIFCSENDAPRSSDFRSVTGAHLRTSACALRPRIGTDTIDPSENSFFEKYESESFSTPLAIGMTSTTYMSSEYRAGTCFSTWALHTRISPVNKDYFRIEGRAGEKTLSGELAIRPAKNAVLKAMASSILFNGKLMLEGVPYIEDVYRMRELLEYGGGVITEEKRMLTIDGEAFSKTEMHPDIAGKFRASIVLTGPMLARFNEVRFPHPGGCVIGARPIDIFLNNYEKIQIKNSKTLRHSAW